MNNEYVTLKEYTNPVIADIEKQVLQDNGIECYIVDNNMAVIYSNAVGYTYVQVHKDDVEKARGLLEQNQVLDEELYPVDEEPYPEDEEITDEVHSLPKEKKELNPILQAIIFTGILVFLGNKVGGTTRYFAGYMFGEDILYNNYFQALFDIFDFSIIFFLISIGIKDNIIKRFSIKSFPLPVIPLLFLIGIGAFELSGIFTGLFRDYIYTSKPLSYEFFQSTYGYSDIVSSIILLTIVAPIFEELFFRGFIQRRLQGKYSPATAIFTSAILFGVIHISPDSIFSAAIGGIIMGYVFYKTRSVIATIFLHALYNGQILFYHYIYPISYDDYLYSTKYPEISFDYIGLLQILLLGIALFLLYSYYKKKEISL